LKTDVGFALTLKVNPCNGELRMANIGTLTAYTCIVLKWPFIPMKDTQL
jgi:hypothetical protein